MGGFGSDRQQPQREGGLSLSVGNLEWLERPNKLSARLTILWLRKADDCCMAIVRGRERLQYCNTLQMQYKILFRAESDIPFFRCPPPCGTVVSRRSEARKGRRGGAGRARGDTEARTPRSGWPCGRSSSSSRDGPSSPPPCPRRRPVASPPSSGAARRRRRRRRPGRPPRGRAAAEGGAASPGWSSR